MPPALPVPGQPDPGDRGGLPRPGRGDRRRPRAWAGALGRPARVAGGRPVRRAGRDRRHDPGRPVRRDQPATSTSCSSCRAGRAPARRWWASIACRGCCSTTPTVWSPTTSSSWARTRPSSATSPPSCPPSATQAVVQLPLSALGPRSASAAWILRPSAASRVTGACCGCWSGGCATGSVTTDDVELRVGGRQVSLNGRRIATRARQLLGRPHNEAHRELRAFLIDEARRQLTRAGVLTSGVRDQRPGRVRPGDRQLPRAGVAAAHPAVVPRRAAVEPPAARHGGARHPARHRDRPPGAAVGDPRRHLAVVRGRHPAARCRRRRCSTAGRPATSTSSSTRPRTCRPCSSTRSGAGRARAP